MEHVPRNSPYTFCVFCEDIREEINAKETYVGVFPGPDMNILGSLPANVGKFTIKVYYSQRPTDPILPVDIEVLLPGDGDDKPSARLGIDLPTIVDRLPPPPPELEDPFVQTQLTFTFNPLTIKEEGHIVVRAVRGDQVFKVRSLAIRAQGSPSSPKLTGVPSDA